MLMIERGDRHLGYLDLAVIMRKWVYHLHDDLMVSTKILSLSLLCRNIVQWNEPYTVIQDYECIHMCRIFYILTIIFNSLNGMYWIWLYIEKHKIFYCYSIIFSIFRWTSKWIVIFLNVHWFVCIILLHILKDWLSYFYRSQHSNCKIVEDFNVDRFVIYLLNNMFRPLIVRNLM